MAVGGTLGTAARAGVALAMATQDTGSFPSATFAVNIVGAFLLGALFTLLPAGRGHSAHAESIRLFFGTGFLGGFTTYSVLAVDTAGLLISTPVLGLGYALATLVLGGTATWLGILTAHKAKQNRTNARVANAERDPQARGHRARRRREHDHQSRARDSQKGGERP